MTENIKQEQFINFYLENGNIKESAEKTGITEATAHKWLNNGLRAEIKTKHALIVQENMRRLISNYGAVQNVLLGIIKDSSQNPRDRLKAIEIFYNQTNINIDLLGIQESIQSADSPFSFL